MINQCEAGYNVKLGQDCAMCGRRSDQHCGKAPPDPRNAKIAQLKGDLDFANSLIVDLQNELKGYREREKVQGWADF